MRSLIAIIGLALITGCGASTTAAPIPTVTAEQATTTPTVTPASAVPRRVGLKQASVSDDGEVSVTVLRYRQPFRNSLGGLIGRRGYEYAAFETKVCIVRNYLPEPVSVSWYPWTLTYDSGLVVRALSSYVTDGWEGPLYPQDYLLKVGRCARGWIPFEIRKGEGRPDRIEYNPAGTSPLEWVVK